MRTSQYTVCSTDRFVDGAGNHVRVVMNTATGRVFTLPSAVADDLAGGRPPNLGPVSAELTSVRLLTESDSEYADAVEHQRRESRHRTRSFVLMPTAACNFDCGYCGQQNSSRSWSDDETRAVIDRMESAASSGRHSAISVGWFGGEPLIAYRRMREVSRAAVDICDRHELAYHAKIVTNGSLLDARRLRELHTEMRVMSIEITIDGPSGQHDLLRPTRSGRDSYSRIIASLQTLVQDDELSGLSAVVRTNISRLNRAFAEQFSQEMADSGLAHERVTFYPSPVRTWGKDVSAVALNPGEAVGAEIEWLAAYLRHGLHCSVIPTRAPAPICVAVDPQAEVIAPDGSLYACTEQPLVPGRSQESLGPARDTTADRTATFFDHWSPTEEMPCASCAVYPLCGGRCPLAWRDGSPPCPILRQSLSRRLDLYALEAGLAPELAAGSGPDVSTGT